MTHGGRFYAKKLECRATPGSIFSGPRGTLRREFPRFVQRHWVAVSAAAALLVSLVAATAVSFRQAAVARTESAKARQLNHLLTQILSSANPTWTNAGAAQALPHLDRALALYREQGDALGVAWTQEAQRRC